MNQYSELLGFEPDESLLFDLNAHFLTGIKIIQLKARPDLLVTADMSNSQRELAATVNIQKQNGIQNLQQAFIEEEIIKRLQ